MKAFAVFLLGVSGLCAAPLDFDSKISRVTVYAERASVLRVAEVQIPTGRSVLRFRGLPASASVETVQITGKTNARVTILGSELKSTFTSEAMNEEVRKLQAELQGVEDQIRGLEGRVEDLLKQKRFLDSLRGALGGTDSKGAVRGINEIKDLYGFYSTEQGATTKELLEVHRGIDGLKPEQERLRKEIARLESGAVHQAREVWVAVDAEQATQAELGISYAVPEASWKPVYDARVDTSNARIILQSLGVVRQETGENWEGVQLELSTAQVEVGANMPKLLPWWVQLFPSLGAMSAPKSTAQPDGTQAEGARPFLAREAEWAKAEIRSSGTTTVFQVPLSVSIASNNEPTRVPISQTNFTGEIEYVATPKLSEHAYMRSKAKNTSGGPLLGGDVSLFCDGVYVGKAELPFTAADADFVLYLGIDESIRIERQLLVDRSEQSGLIRKRKGVTRLYRTTIENWKKGPVSIRVFDQIPVSQNPEVSVTGVVLKPEPKSVEHANGEVEWVIEAKTGEKQVIDLGFTIEWPADKEIGI